MSTAVIKKNFFKKRKTPKATCNSQKFSFNQVHFFLMITPNDCEMFA